MSSSASSLTTRTLRFHTYGDPNEVLRLENMHAVHAATLVVEGSASPPWMREALRTLVRAIPGARLHTLEGQTHAVDPKLLAPVIAEFFTESSSKTRP